MTTETTIRYNYYPTIDGTNNFDAPTYYERIKTGYAYSHDLLGFITYCEDAEATRILAFVDGLPSAYVADYEAGRMSFDQLWADYEEDQNRYLDCPQLPYAYACDGNSVIAGRTYSEWLTDILADGLTAGIVANCSDDELAADFDTLAHEPDEPAALALMLRILWDDDSAILRNDIEHYLSEAVTHKARETGRQD